MIELVLGDCLVEMSALPDASADFILADLPFGVTNCSWDNQIPFAPLWAHYERLIKPNGAIVLFGTEPFASHLRLSNPRLYRYDWVWDKVNLKTGFLNANKMPMRRHEMLMVFYASLPTYNPQWIDRKPVSGGRRRGHPECYGRSTYGRPATRTQADYAYPDSVLAIPGMGEDKRGLHPTQKPVALLEFLIKTYTNEGETVLDNCFGSASCGVACINTGRSFIGIEKDTDYFNLGQQRIKDAQAQPALLAA